MSNQHSMFSPQENVPHEQINTDPREQPAPYKEPTEQQQAGAQDSYEAGYGWTQPGGDWMSGEKLHPGQRAYHRGFPDSLRRLSVWQWVIILVLLTSLGSVFGWLLSAIFGLIFFALSVVVVFLLVTQISLRKIAMPKEVFLVSGQPDLIINNPTGAVHIRRGSTDQIEITAIKYINGLLGSTYQGIVSNTQEGNIITVNARSDYKWLYLGGLRNVDFEITVPEFSNIQVKGGTGAINVEGINGCYQLKTYAGTVKVQQGTLSGASSISTNAGTIQVMQSNLRGEATFLTNAGTIQYHGSIDPQGSYNFTTNLGTIDIALPSRSSFSLKAHTDLGNVNNQFGSTIIGTQPYAMLELRTNLGTINVRKTT